jgi:Protein of unknown function (DUF1236)
MKILTVAAASIALLASTAVYAQNAGGAVGGAVGGAAIGTAAGGPIGTAVGAGIGAIVGSTLPAHPSVRYEHPVVVGTVMPEDYTYYPVPNNDGYDYVIVNNERVIVDRHSHRVLRVIK